MPRFIAGDELGNLKFLRYDSTSETKASLEIALLNEQPRGAVQALVVGSRKESEPKKMAAAAYADGSICAYALDQDDVEMSLEFERREKRLQKEQRFVGLSIADRGIYSCTSNGALRLHSWSDAEKATSSTALPIHLRDWKLSQDQKSFAYGGHEVELSLWDCERAFDQVVEKAETNKKRKRNDDLFPGESWRAKNVPNDSLGLRQPVRISSLAYLTSTSQHILTGTELGDVRRYDTRAGRRPVSNWSNISQGSAVKALEKGLAEHEAFVSNASNGLFAIDLRNGRTLYKYRGVAGAVNSIAPSPSVLATTGLDRFARLYSTVAPPKDAGHQGNNAKGDVLEKLYTKSIPTVVVWDGESQPGVEAEDDEIPDDEMWDAMKHVGATDDDLEGRKKRKS